MAQWSRGLSALPGTQVLFPTPTKGTHSAFNSTPRGAVTLFWPVLVLHTYGVQTHKKAKHTDTLNNNKKQPMV